MLVFVTNFPEYNVGCYCNVCYFHQCKHWCAHSPLIYNLSVCYVCLHACILWLQNAISKWKDIWILKNIRVFVHVFDLGSVKEVGANSHIPRLASTENRMQIFAWIQQACFYFPRYKLEKNVVFQDISLEKCSLWAQHQYNTDLTVVVFSNCHSDLPPAALMAPCLNESAAATKMCKLVC